MALTGAQYRRLSEALRSAFTLAGLDRLLLFSLDIRREDIALGSDLQEIAFRVIQTAESEAWTLRLLTAARDARPAHPVLAELASELGLASASRELETRVRHDAPFVDIAQWRERLGRLEGQVCRVEVEAGARSTIGTGFLVGPDLVMTNHHVVAPVVEGHGAAADVVLRFDYKRVDGLVVHPGLEVRLAADWLVALSPPSTADLSDDAADLPTVDELDYAVLRLATTVGDDPPGLVRQDPEAPPRGWVEAAGRTPDDGAPLLVLQHPEGQPLKLALGDCGATNTNGTRVLHRVNTEPGSSGSPCLDARLDVVALHHLGDPRWSPGAAGGHNQAVPLAAIAAHLERTGVPVPVLGLAPAP